MGVDGRRRDAWMNKPPDFEQAQRYAVARLTRELSPTLYYHDVAHTCHDVLPAVTQLAALESVCAGELLLLQTAALYHDIGHIVQYEGHEAVSIRIAADVLPDCGYAPEQVATVVDLIAVTQLDHQPATLLERIMKDADLDVLGRPDFFRKNASLLKELRVHSQLNVSSLEWYCEQFMFLHQHRYFTDAAHRLRNEQKQQNIMKMQALLRSCKPKDI